MKLKEKLPLSYLLFTSLGRINRSTYWIVSLFIWTTFYLLFTAFSAALPEASTLFLYPVLLWSLAATATKRLHDSNKTAWWWLCMLIPVLGPLALIYLLGFKKGAATADKFGEVPGTAPDYFRNADGTIITEHSSHRIINDVTAINPVVVHQVAVPSSIETLQHIIRTAALPVSIGGGRFSMGGQTASPNTIHIDMRSLNKMLHFSPDTMTIQVEAGMRWCDIQAFADKHNLSLKIMQTYANFTVGGSLSVNCHGRYIGLGPVILSVKSLEVVLANGDRVRTSPLERPELFYACVGCYNAVAVIVTAELELTPNVLVKRMQKKMPVGAYKNYFKEHIRDNKNVVFHNGDIYTPEYKHVRAVSWVLTNEKTTTDTRLMPLAAAYPIERYFIGTFSKSRFGKWRREYLIDPLVYLGKKVHYRNYEAGYDVLELEPASRKTSTYVLQEYFTATENFDRFVSLMAAIFQRHNVNVINVSIRHAQPDPGSLLAWAREEVFAFVVWYKQGTAEADKNKVGVWTRELIDAALSLGGSYYLPYQPHATTAQFHQAYPNAAKLFALKQQLDPGYKFRNVLWDKYYQTANL